jgi:hypothetical protein
LLLATAAPDPWTTLVRTHADRDAVIAALGKPSGEFVSGVDAGTTPIQLSSAMPERADDAKPQTVVKVLEYAELAEGLHEQVVLQDGHVIWAVAAAPKGAKAGKLAAKREDLLVDDLLRSFERLDDPAKKIAWIRRPGSDEILARQILP